MRTTAKRTAGTRLLAARGRSVKRLHADDERDSALTVFVRSGARRWSSERIPLAGAVTGAFWTVLVVNLAVACWALSAAAVCHEWICGIATLGNRSWLVAVLAVSCVAALGGVALKTRGLSFAGAGALALMIFGAVCGLVAPLGLVAVVVLFVAVLGLGLVVFILFVDCF